METQHRDQPAFLNERHARRADDLKRFERSLLRRLETRFGAGIAHDERTTGAEVLDNPLPVIHHRKRNVRQRLDTLLVTRRHQPVVILRIGIERAIDAEMFAQQPRRRRLDFNCVEKRAQRVV